MVTTSERDLPELTNYLRSEERQVTIDTTHMVLSSLVIAGAVFNVVNAQEIYALPGLDKISHTALEWTNTGLGCFGVITFAEGLYRRLNSGSMLENTREHIKERGFRIRGFFLNRTVSAS